MTPALVGESIDTPLLGELRYGLELAGLLRDPVFLTARPQRHAPPVLLVPGFMAGDASLTVLRGWLRRRGSRTSSAGIRLNVDCAERAVGRLEVRLRRLVERAGRRAVVIGQSRGGELARVLATRNPDAVSTLVMLGSPVVAPLSVGRPVLSAVRSVARLGDLGIPGVFSTRCADGECCATFREDLLAPLAPDVRAVAVYSRSDGIVSWQACLDPGARHVEVDSSHGGMSVHRDIYRLLAEILAEESAWTG
ncbi:MAG TPA: alpha/beta hydrolase [Solirubrobacteraceae bacterium]|nr:alpha/beta hydrolase [Solirubrobacteraceae bacterium]